MYEKQTTVQGIEFSNCLKIIGANSSGKSTLVKVVTGVIKDQALIFAKKKQGKYGLCLRKHIF